MATHAKVPHLALPFRIHANGSANVLEQDTRDEVAQSVRVLVSTREGERIEVPAYGIPDLVFDVQSPEHIIDGAVEEWEPRASIVLEEEPDLLDELIRNLRVRVAQEG